MSNPQSTERPGRDAERSPRDMPRPEAATDARQPPSMTGFWSSDGRLFSPMALNDNAGAAERLVQGWQEALASQRAMLDAMRDMMRRQQDLMLAATRSMFSAAMDPERASVNPAAASLERCAAQYGVAWRRGLDQAWANYRAVLEMPSLLPTAANEASPAQRSDRTG